MSNTVALVTGASSGMGKDFVKGLLAQGMIVYAAARRVEKMQDIKGLGAIPVKMDITNEADIQRCLSQVTSEHGGIDILVNNAGFGLFGAMEDVSLEDARYQFDVNLFGLARLTQCVLPYMREKGSGKIINITSIGGKMHTPLGSWYHATKFALEGWSDCLRIEVKQFGIDVVIIEPGAILTEFGDVATQPMLKRSGQGPYAKLAKATEKLHRQEYEKQTGSPPSVITKLVVKACLARKPKTRYAAGRYAASMLFMRRWLSDRTFDRLMSMMVG